MRIGTFTMADTLTEVAGNARRAAVLASVCVVVALIVLMLDWQAKNAILKGIIEARGILNRFEAVAHEATGGPAPVVGAGAGGVGDAGGEPAGGVGFAAASGAPVDKAGGNRRVARPVRPGVEGGGPVGDSS